MRPVQRGPLPAREGARGSNPKRVVDYSYYRPDLVANMGEYCSYCEVPLGVNLAVEHVLSKVNSLNAEDWDNLLLACTNCNSRKQKKTETVDDLNNYYWPTDSFTDGFNSFDMLTYTKAAKTVKGLAAEGVFLWPPNRPQYYYPNPAATTYDQVWVLPSSTYANNVTKSKKIKNTILLTGLNDFTPDDVSPKASDRRVFNRTTAWTRASAMATQLAAYYNAATQNQAAIDLLKAQVKETAIATGFWSVWMTVFKSHNFVNNQTRNLLLNELFANPNVFPGTAYKAR